MFISPNQTIQPYSLPMQWDNQTNLSLISATSLASSLLQLVGSSASAALSIWNNGTLHKRDVIPIVTSAAHTLLALTSCAIEAAYISVNGNSTALCLMSECGVCPSTTFTGGNSTALCLMSECGACPVTPPSCPAPLPYKALN